MPKFQIQHSASTINWTGKKVLGLHTGIINVADGYIELSENNVMGGEIEIDMTSIVITDIADVKTNNDFLAHLKNDDFFSVDKFNRAKLVISNATRQEGDKYR